jgi:N-ethylmaleimide reductase
MTESDPQGLYEYLVDKLNQFNLAYLHVVERFAGSPETDFNFKALADKFNGAYMANGTYTGESAEASLASGDSDLVSFGMPYIANPDLVERIKQGAELAEADQATLYGGDDKGYTDYPALA